MRLRINNKQFIAEDILQINFKIRNSDFSFLPGQFVRVDFIESSEELKKTPHFFSIVSSPNDKKNLSIAAFIRDSSEYKRRLRDLQVSDSLEVSQAFGRFLLPDKKERIKSLVFIAGGIGITPFISMLRFITEENLKIMATILYSVKSISQAPFLEELEKYEQSDFKLMKVVTVTGDQSFMGQKGRINPDLVKKNIANLPNSLYYIAGSVEFVSSVKIILTNLNINPTQIRTDNFSGY